MNQEQVVNRLIEGNDRFVADKLNGTLNDSTRRDELVSGQNPHTIVLSCADSRVVPELAFDAGLGELFVVRVAGNIANTESVASIEYAVAHLGTQVILVMGHQSCGAVTAAVKGGDNGPNLNQLLEQIKPAIEKAGANASIDEVIRKNAELTKNDLITKSNIIKKAVKTGDVKIIPAYYNLESGKVSFL